MTENKLYILSCDANLTSKLFIDYPSSWFVKAIIKLSTWSNINHIADTYTNYCNTGNLVNQAVGTGYESIPYTRFLENRQYSTIRAHEIIVPIDFKKWHEDTKAQRGREYDRIGAEGSALDKVPIFRKIFKKAPDDKELFCSEAPVEKLQNQGYLTSVKNKNNVNPKELIELLEEHGLVKPPFVVSKNGKIINNIWT